MRVAAILVGGSVALVTALALVGLAGRRRMRAQVAAEVDELFALAGAGLRPDILDARRPELPTPIQRHLEYAFGAGAVGFRTARLRHEGVFRWMGPEQRWFPIEGVQYFTVREPGFVWNATIRVAPFLWIEARDRLLNGRGNMLVKFCSAATLADARGPEMNQGSFMRWLAEAVWFPAGYAGDRIRWEAIDDRSARAVLLHDGLPVSLILEVDEEGKLVQIAGQRYQAAGVLLPWKAICRDYREFGGVRIPTSIEAVWELPEGGSATLASE